MHMNNLSKSCKASLLFSNRMSEKICRRRKKIGEEFYMLSNSILSVSLHLILTTFFRLSTFSSFISTIVFDRRDKDSRNYTRDILAKSHYHYSLDAGTSH